MTNRVEHKKEYTISEAIEFIQKNFQSDNEHNGDLAMDLLEMLINHIDSINAIDVDVLDEFYNGDNASECHALMISHDGVNNIDIVQQCSNINIAYTFYLSAIQLNRTLKR